ncbi:5-oxoprolinase subunit PxpA [Spongiivirga citrea]|uniref:5-oxoprolinase subunit PxpA n=1 Tax=Spongiivirga citrea TaxID=1481457 RepID=A0A6M0CLS4_9FLAO|nr:5-oxoprolinase subunit PxpA [Spongiivirga citrea]NER16377.1 5-oxoprolinase subunit PxpA [Spongiivirga citrea]
MKTVIDINCDLEEGFPYDEELMKLISSCNIACGGHYGTKDSIVKTIKLAQKYGVKIGAHPAYPDKANFGRTVLDIDNHSLQSSIEDQLQLFKNVADDLNESIHHIKPHGALYNVCAKNKEIANSVLKAIVSVYHTIPIYAPYKSVIADLAKGFGIPVIYEAFADRNYNDDLSLVARSQNNALIHDPIIASNHVLNMIGGKLLSVTGNEHKIQAETFCVHGDNPAALKLVDGLVKSLTEKGFTIA